MKTLSISAVVFLTTVALAGGKELPGTVAATRTLPQESKASPEAALLKKTRTLYRSEQWPLTKAKRVAGCRIRNIEISGFRLDDVRFCQSAIGTTYIWKNDSEKFSVHVTINVCSSAEETKSQMIDWMSRVTSPLKRGSPSGAPFGDICFSDSDYLVIAFIRMNVKVIINATGKSESGAEAVENFAAKIDERIKHSPTIWLLRPFAKTKLKKPKLSTGRTKIGKKVTVMVRPADRRRAPLVYAYRATGGNIITTTEGQAVYLPKEKGRQSIEVLVGNIDNVISKRTVELLVE